MPRSQRDLAQRPEREGTVSHVAARSALLAQALEGLGAGRTFGALELASTQSHVPAPRFQARGVFCVLLLEEPQSRPHHLARRTVAATLELLVHEGLEFRRQ